MAEQRIIRRGIEARRSPVDGIWRAWAWLILPGFDFPQWVTVAAHHDAVELSILTRDIRPASTWVGLRPEIA